MILIQTPDDQSIEVRDLPDGARRIVLNGSVLDLDAESAGAIAAALQPHPEEWYDKQYAAHLETIDHG